MDGDDHNDTHDTTMDNLRKTHEKPREKPREEERASAAPDICAESDDWDDIAEASYESFPASDAPGWSRGS